MQERRKAIANAMELRHYCTNPSIWFQNFMGESPVFDITTVEDKHSPERILLLFTFSLCYEYGLLPSSSFGCMCVIEIIFILFQSLHINMDSTKGQIIRV